MSTVDESAKGGNSYLTHEKIEVKLKRGCMPSGIDQTIHGGEKRKGEGSIPSLRKPTIGEGRRGGVEDIMGLKTL